MDRVGSRFLPGLPRCQTKVEEVLRKSPAFLSRTRLVDGTVELQLFIPFTLAILFLISHQYELDPILVFLGQSETTPFRTLRIREPYVKKLLLGRAIWVSVLVAALVTALTLIFWAVPGYRL